MYVFADNERAYPDTSSRVAPQETVSNEQSPVPAFLYWGSFLCLNIYHKSMQNSLPKRMMILQNA
jgi:hypothetical protein